MQLSILAMDGVSIWGIANGMGHRIHEMTQTELGVQAQVSLTNYKYTISRRMKSLG